jgi:hypothetical protein
MINLNSKTNQKQFIAIKIKVESVLELVNLGLLILRIPKIAGQISIIKMEQHTLITNIKIVGMNNHVVGSMVMTLDGLQQKNGKYGRLRWRDEE